VILRKKHFEYQFSYIPNPFAVCNMMCYIHARDSHILLKGIHYTFHADSHCTHAHGKYSSLFLIEVFMLKITLKARSTPIYKQ
jgi:hypothetical protein